MAGRLSRFLNLEGARPARENGEAASGAAAKGSTMSGRFNPPPAADVSSSNAAEELQELRRAQLQSGLALDEQSDEVQPFVRCGQCETDSARGTSRCKTCGADLETPMQRAFNEELWKARKLEMQRESEEVESRKRQEAEGGSTTPTSIAEQQRAIGELLAGQVRDREASRLSWMDGGESSTGNRPIGMRLLDKIPSPLWRFVTSIALLLAACYLGWRTFTTPRSEQNPLVQLGFFALLFLFIPIGRRRGLFGRNRW